MKLKVGIELWSNDTEMVVYGINTRDLVKKYQANPSDENFQELADYIMDDVASELDFTIQEIEVVE